MKNNDSKDKISLIESGRERERHMHRIELLEMIGELLLLPNTELATTNQVAKFYDVDVEVIRKVAQRNKEELGNNGMSMMKYAEVKEKLRLDNMSILESDLTQTLVNTGVNKRGSNIFTKRAILNVGMLLRDSEVAKELRNQILNTLENTSDEVKIQSVDEEKQLLMNIMFAKNEAERAVALSEHVEYTNRHIENLNAQLEKQQPMVEFTNQCLKSDTSILVREMSKILQGEGKINLGERKLFQKLRDWELILKDSTEPSQKGMNLELFEVVQRPINTQYRTILQNTTKITPKGQLYIIKRLNKEKGEN